MSNANPAAPRDRMILEQARDASIPSLVDAFTTALSHFDDGLFDRAEKAGHSQLEFLDGLRELRRRRLDVIAGFRLQLEKAWKAMAAGNPLSVEDVLAAPLQGGELTLVSEQELESRLAARNLANVILRECKPVLTRLGQRLVAISGVHMEVEHNPIGSEHVSVAVREAFSRCDLSVEVLLVLFKLSERELLPHLAGAYVAVDRRLTELGIKAAELAKSAPPPPRETPRAPHDDLVLPGLDTLPLREAPASTPFNAAPIDHDKFIHDRRASNRFVASADEPQARVPAWAARFAQRMAGARAAMQTPPADAGGPGEFSGFDDLDALLGNVAASSAPASADFADVGGEQGVLLQALHYFMQEARQNRGAPSYAPAPGQRAMSQQEMLSALSMLQSEPSSTLREAIGKGDESLAQRLKNEVLASALRMGVSAREARLSPLDEDAIDLVGMLFDVLLDERGLHGHSRELIGRLAIPFVKVAMLDRHLFVEKTHPARRFLNALAESLEGSEGDSAAERTLTAKVEEIVGRLVAEFNENIAIFQTLEEEFREFLAQHKRRIEIAERRAAEIQRGQEKLEAARARMQRELDARVQGGEPPPKAVDDFLRRPWAHHVTMTLLREGEDSDGLREALQLADALLAELSEARSRFGGQRAWLESSEAALKKVFASVGLNADATETAIDALRATLQAVAQARPDLEKALPELPQVALPKAGDDDAAIHLVGGTDTLQFDPTDAAHFRDLPLGTWLDFVDKDNRVQAGKLSWVSPISQRLMFVNRRGVRFCVASPEELAAMVRMGRLRKHDAQLDAFDSAMQGVLDRLDGDAA